MNSSFKERWKNRSGRNRHRGDAGLLEVIARRELNEAANLYSSYCLHLTGTVLDLGAGNGAIWRLTKPPANLIAIDLAPENFLVDRLNGVMRADARILPIKDRSVIVILALGLLEYLAQPEDALREWRRVCDRGARMILSNSSPVLPNLIRRRLWHDVAVRADLEVMRLLSDTGWRLVEPLPRRAGWQSLFITEASI